MTATDELRRLLDERGVEYDGETYEGVTFWNEDTNKAIASGDYGEKLWVSQCLTPEQAVEATLGSGECTVVSKLLIEGEYVPSSYYEFEMECGEGFKWDESIPPRFCPNCGRKVVDA